MSYLSLPAPWPDLTDHPDRSVRHRNVVTTVPDGLEAALIAEFVDRIVAADHPSKSCIFVARDGPRAKLIADALGFFAPGLDILELPAWDCMPYDRVSPNTEIIAQRMAALADLVGRAEDRSPQIILTTANALVQRLPPAEMVRQQSITAVAGRSLEMSALQHWLGENGFVRTPTVREAGEFAVRGGILDLFSPGADAPVRLDFFGSTLESIRTFDPQSQRTTAPIKTLNLVPASEVHLTPETIAAFRASYRQAFGAPTREDQLYGAISDGLRYPGMEHWLAHFYPALETMLDYTAGMPILFDHLAFEATDERLAQVAEHYQSRVEGQEMAGGGAPYHPAVPDSLYLSAEELDGALKGRTVARLTSYAEMPESQAVDLGGKIGRNFAAERQSSSNIYEELVHHVTALKGERLVPVIACWTEGSCDRLQQVLADHELGKTKLVGSWREARDLPAGTTGFAVLPLEQGFVADGVAVVSEQDVLGDRLVRTGKRGKRSQDFLTDITGLNPDDLVVHVDHGIGRFKGLNTIVAAGAPHDCLELHYAGGDKLFLPVENLDLLSRYGSGETEVQLDRLGGVAWQSKKAKLKKRIREMADQLIKIAAARALRRAPIMSPPEGLYGEFLAQFPYEETEDQLTSINAVVADLGAGQPMDRLVCGDVGFGKTEVALRAAFLATMSGHQVAVVVPTTLLARQHFETFSTRFHGLPVRVEHASRLVPTKQLNATKQGMKDGTVDIVVGTHALLGSKIGFRDLGLLIVDEEQHFGVRHKERLKELKSEVHVLTLTATPIPRTLQMALTGVRDLSLITTPPIDRLAVRTFISPFDGLVVRETLLRERYRGGQSFYVCPRISDLATIKDFLDQQVPELKVAVAHGQMPPGQLEDIMTGFYDGNYDVLLSTTIIESGLDIPRANTLVVHRAEMFGLAQLYQIRGRVGRSKTRAYALLTTPPGKKLTAAAERRLKVLQSLDTLGAGFQLASHDLDIRGSGNLLGEEQSGQIKEVGFELYQQMLEEAVATLKAGDGDSPEEDQWSPQITIGTPVLIPDHYVADLQLRMQLYRRLADLTDASEIDAFGAEMIDRFGPLPSEVDHLLKIVFIKGLCRAANIAKIDAGPKGLVITVRNNIFPNPEGLIGYIAKQGENARIRPDQTILIKRDWPSGEAKLKGTAVIMSQLARLVE